MSLLGSGRSDLRQTGRESYSIQRHPKPVEAVANLEVDIPRLCLGLGSGPLPSGVAQALSQPQAPCHGRHQAHVFPSVGGRCQRCPPRGRQVVLPGLQALSAAHCWTHRGGPSGDRGPVINWIHSLTPPDDVDDQWAPQIAPPAVLAACVRSASSVSGGARTPVRRPRNPFDVTEPGGVPGGESGAEPVVEAGGEPGATFRTKSGVDDR